jgi:hypothetical protein
LSYYGALAPAIDPTVEEESITFDFGPALGTGVSITSVDFTSCVVVQGVDPDAASRIINPPAPALIASPATGAPNAAVVLLVGEMLAGVNYQLQCVVVTSDGQMLSLRADLPCATLPGG